VVVLPQVRLLKKMTLTYTLVELNRKVFLNHIFFHHFQNVALPYKSKLEALKAANTNTCSLSLHLRLH